MFHTHLCEAHRGKVSHCCPSLLISDIQASSSFNQELSDLLASMIDVFPVGSLRVIPGTSRMI